MFIQQFWICKLLPFSNITIFIHKKQISFISPPTTPPTFFSIPPQMTSTYIDKPKKWKSWKKKVLYIRLSSLQHVSNLFFFFAQTYGFFFFFIKSWKKEERLTRFESKRHALPLEMTVMCIMHKDNMGFWKEMGIGTNSVAFWPVRVLKCQKKIV